MQGFVWKTLERNTNTEIKWISQILLVRFPSKWSYVNEKLEEVNKNGKFCKNKNVRLAGDGFAETSRTI